VSDDLSSARNPVSVFFEKLGFDADALRDKFVN
jgi:hypothetical protein